MAQYIDKDALVAEIDNMLDYADARWSSDYITGARRLAIKLKDAMNTLEVKKVDNIWHTISESDLPRVGERICAILGQKKAYGAYVVSGEYRENKFYGKVCNGYDNSIEKGDKWCYLSDLLVSIGEVKEVDLERELIEWHKEHFKKDGTFIGKSGFYLTNNSQIDIAKHFFELGLKAKQG